MIAAIVETSTLAEVVLYSLIGGVGGAVVFGAGVASAASLLDAVREHRTAAGAAWGVLTVGCVAVTLGMIILGIVVMSSSKT
jgi:hypothetical protein